MSATLGKKSQAFVINRDKGRVKKRKLLWSAVLNDSADLVAFSIAYHLVDQIYIHI
jgi:hypothetical protein